MNTARQEGRRRLRRAARACQDYGQRVQLSVFECEVDPAHDSLRVYHLGAEGGRRGEHIGEGDPGSRSPAALLSREADGRTISEHAARATLVAQLISRTGKEIATSRDANNIADSLGCGGSRGSRDCCSVTLVGYLLDSRPSLGRGSKRGIQRADVHARRSPVTETRIELEIGGHVLWIGGVAPSRGARTEAYMLSRAASSTQAAPSGARMDTAVATAT